MQLFSTLSLLCGVLNVMCFINKLALTSGDASQRMVEAQPETRAVMKLILERGQTLSVSLDGGALLATYPYDKPVQTGNTTQIK